MPLPQHRVGSWWWWELTRRWSLAVAVVQPAAVVVIPTTYSLTPSPFTPQCSLIPILHLLSSTSLLLLITSSHLKHTHNTLILTAGGGSSDVLEREEWMLVPGEDRGLGVETFGVSRKFSTGECLVVSDDNRFEMTALEHTLSLLTNPL